MATFNLGEVPEPQRDPSAEEYQNETDIAGDAASQLIADKRVPTEVEYQNEADRASDAVTIEKQKDPSSVEYENEADKASDAVSFANTSAQGTTAAKLNTQSQATQQNVVNAGQRSDWRVALRLAKYAGYLYKSIPVGSAGILEPLRETDGVIFPYTPAISIGYAASYTPTEAVHSNYKIFQYSSSAVDNITVTCDFTAQDTREANYLLAVIHFFKTITKMFYGKDQYPTPGPPLCYLTGLGAFQFDNHPIAITNFTYNLPNNVDYIRATKPTTAAGVSAPNGGNGMTNVSGIRLGSLSPGAIMGKPSWKTANPGSPDTTYVPTKIQLQITAVPIVSRADISDRFSLEKYATGDLLRGSNNSAGGIW